MILTLATTADAGRVFIINNGIFDVEYWYEGMKDGNKFMHNNNGQRKVIHYVNGTSIAVRAKWTGMAWQNVTVKPDTDIILDFWGTIFSPQVKITEEYHKDSPQYNGEPFKCMGCMT